MHEHQKTLSACTAQENQGIVYFSVHGETGVFSNCWWQRQTQSTNALQEVTKYHSTKNVLLSKLGSLVSQLASSQDVTKATRLFQIHN